MAVDDVIMSESTLKDLDPFNALHKYVHELILQHGIGLICSEVSESWAKMIAGSKKAMMNITLNVTDERGRPPTSDELQTIVNSDRKYFKMIFDTRYPQTYLDSCQVLIKNKESLVELTVGKILFSDQDIWDAYIFHKLESLTIRHGECQKLVMHLLRTSKKIKSLVLKDQVQYFSRRFGYDILDFFQLENYALKHLELNYQFLACLYGRDISSLFKIKLESLRINFGSWNSMEIFKKFLSSQAGSLKSLTLSVFFHHLMKTIIEDLTVLENLTIYDERHFDPTDIPQYTRPNLSIKEITLRSFTIPLLKFLLVVMPNLKVMRLSWATNMELKVIVETGLRLEKIYLTHNRDSSEAFYNFIKEQNVEMNRNVQFIQI